MLLILFLKVEIEHILVFPKIMLHMRRKVQRQCSFLQKYIKTSLKHLIQNCYFTVSNSLLRQKIDIPMGNDPAPFWANQFLCTWKNEYMSDLMSNDKVKARHFHATKRSIDDLGTLNDGSVFNDVHFLKLRYHGKRWSVIYKLFDKRDDFPFLIVRIPYIDSNIPNKYFILLLLVNSLE